MADRPIIFSAPMVKALLAGTKSQTRRLLTPRSTLFNGGPWPAWAKAERWDWDGAWVDPGPSPMGNPGPYLKLPHADENDDVSDWGGTVHRLYPAIWLEDRLWVREAWSHTGEGVWTIADARRSGSGRVVYRAGHEEARVAGPRVDMKWWPSIHMPREFSRLTLTVTAVRVQRLGDISEEDAIAEGCPARTAEDLAGMDPRGWFRDLWESLHGAGSWAANPWVSVITFETRRGNIDA